MLDESLGLIQVCASFGGPTTRRREVNGLAVAMRTPDVDRTTLITLDGFEVIAIPRG